MALLKKTGTVLLVIIATIAMLLLALGAAVLSTILMFHAVLMVV